MPRECRYEGAPCTCGCGASSQRMPRPRDRHGARALPSSANRGQRSTACRPRGSSVRTVRGSDRGAYRSCLREPVAQTRIQRRRPAGRCAEHAGGHLHEEYRRRRTLATGTHASAACCDWQRKGSLNRCIHSRAPTQHGGKHEPHFARWEDRLPRCKGPMRPFSAAGHRLRCRTVLHGCTAPEEASAVDEWATITSSFPPARA